MGRFLSRLTAPGSPGRPAFLDALQTKAETRLWHRRFERAHPALVAAKMDASKLRLILGSARSGTSWVARTLAATPSPIRYLHEPIWGIVPKVPFRWRQDGFPYRADLPEPHELLTAARAYTVEASPAEFLELCDPKLRENRWARLDEDWQFALVKEVHGLLAIEPLLAALGCPAVILLRSPLYVVDSLFHRDGHRSRYMVTEERDLFRKPFLERYAADAALPVLSALGKLQRGSDRTSAIIRKVLAVALVQRMFHIVAARFPFVSLCQYEKICQDPKRRLQEMAEFLDLQWGAANSDLLAESSSGARVSPDPHSILRDTASQAQRPLKYLTSEEFESAARILEDCGLSERPQPQ